jgi:hypothetical protein
MADEGFRGLRTSVFPLLMVALVLVPQPAVSQAGRSVEEVGIRLELSGGYVGAKTLAQLERALLDTAELALIEQLNGDLDYILRHQDAVVETLGGVIDEALAKRGFALEQLALEPGILTQLTVRLHLAEQRVVDFDVRFYLLGNTPVVEAIVAADEETVSRELYEEVARTPYRDEHWLSGLITDTVERELMRMPAYAEFDRLVLVQPGAETKVAVALTPRAQVAVLADYRMHLRSLTVPQVSLMPVREELVYYLQALRGAPLSFIEDKLSALRQALYQHLVNNRVLARYQAEARLAVCLDDRVLETDLVVDSQRYLLALGARLALWNYAEEDIEGTITVRAGLLPQSNLTAIGWATYYPGEAQPYVALGAGWLVDYGLLAAGWDLEADSWRICGQYDLHPQLYVAVDVFADEDCDALSEISLRYRLRDFYEIQLLSNLNGEVCAAVAANF